jgi:hypothetical protein
MRKLPYVVALALLTSACGSEDEAAPLDCAWLADEDNCWRQAVRAAQPCLPAEDAVGVFSSDRSTCGYADGAAIRFDTALGELPVGNDHVWDFTVTNGGETCVEFKEKGARTTLITAYGKVTLEDTPGGMAVICPGGDRFEGGLELLSCEAWDRMPGTAHHSSSLSLGFQLLGMGDGSGVLGGGGVSVFECEDE